MISPSNVLSLFALIWPFVNGDKSTSQWSGWGADIFNDRYIGQSAVDTNSIKGITQHCHINYPNGVSATPTIDKGIAYFPTYSGLIVAYNYSACTTKWQTNVTAFLDQYSTITPVQAAVVFAGSRTSPQLHGDTLFIGTQLHALLLAVDRDTGSIIGSTQVNPHPLAIITMSPTFYEGAVFLGTSSSEESAAADPSYQCCSFVGNFAAFGFDRKASHFTTLWNSTMLPEPYGIGGWSGAAVWGGQPAIDTARNQVFIATGNVYAIPDSVQACINSTKNDNETACYPSTVWQESVMALDSRSGKQAWIQRLSALDAWTLACGLPPLGIPPQPQCPPNPGSDADFGMAPSFIRRDVANTTHGRDMVVVGQKNGNIYAIDAANGTIYWTTLTSPDTISSGALIWGIAVDGRQVYFTAVNAGHVSWTLQPSGLNVSNSAYGALDLATGRFAWEVAVPRNFTSFAPPTVTNNLVLVGNSGFKGPAPAANSTAQGSIVFLDKCSGEVMREIAGDSVIFGGVAVEGRFVMFGTGYGPNYALKLPGSFNVWTVPE